MKINISKKGSNCQKKTMMNKQDDIIDIEKQSQALEQYTRCNNLEISGIPNNISDEALETKCTETLEAKISSQ